MADIFSATKRSRIMSAVKNKNTAPELNIRKALYAKGLRYKLHNKTLPGTPDLVIAKHKAIIFVHGCFWHQHDCKAAKLPTTNIEFWQTKLKSNFERDKINFQKLENLGWRIKIIWSCQLKNKVCFKNNGDIDEIFNWVINNLLCLIFSFWFGVDSMI